MKIEYPNGKGRTCQLWLVVTLGIVGLCFLLFPMFGLLPTIEAHGGDLAAIVGGAIVFMAIRGLIGKSLSPRPMWVTVAGVAIIFIILHFLFTSNAPTWALVLIFPIIWTY